MVGAIIDFFGEEPDESRQRLTRDALDIASTDLEHAVTFLRSLPEVDPARIGIVGHSFGATVALDVATRDTTIGSTVIIGMRGELSPTRPANVLLIAGLYDEFYSQSELVKSLASGTGLKTASPNTVYGAFHNGTARRLTIVPTTSHIVEVLHPRLIQEVALWLSDAFESPHIKHDVPYALRVSAQWGALFAWVILLGLLLYTAEHTLAVSVGPRLGGKVIPPWLPFRVLMALAAVAAYTWSVSNLWAHLPRTGLLFCAMSCMTAGRIVANWRTRQHCGHDPLTSPPPIAGYCSTVSPCTSPTARS